MGWIVVALAGSAFLFVPGLLEQFETPKIELVRACGLGALAFGLIAGRAGRPKHWTPLDRAVVAWLAVEIVTTACSVSPRVSLFGETRQHEGLLTSLALAGLYFAARDGFDPPRRIGAALDLVLAIATALRLYAIVQATGHDPLQWRREAVYEGAYARPFATLGHPNLLGVASAAAAALGLALALAGRGLARGLRVGAALLLAVVTLLTLSRAAWLGLLLGAPLALLLALRERGAVRVSGRALAIGAAAAALAAIVVGVSGAWRLVAQRLAELLAGGGGSGGSRLEIWRSALAAFRARPLVGQGPDLFEMVFPRFQTPAYWRFEWSGLPFHAHSIYLHTLATRGMLGLAAAAGWAVALALAARAAWRRRGEVPVPGLVPAAMGALATVAVAGAFGALGIHGALLVVLISAMLAAGAEPAAGEPPAAGPAPARERAGRGAARRQAKRAPGGRTMRAKPTPRRWAARIAAAVVSAAALVSGFTGLRASRAASATQAFMTASPARAASASAYAVALAPREDRLWRMRAESLLWLTTVPDAPPGTLAEAEQAARRAVRLAPARAENHIILARALGAREALGDTGVRAAAEAEYRASLALAPMDGLSLMEYADHASLLGRAGPALEAARRAVALYPAEGAAQAALARAWLAAGAPDSARATLERALPLAWRDAGERQAAAQMLDDLRAAPGRPHTGRP